MYYNYDFYAQIQQLYQYVENQQQKIEQLEATIEVLQLDLETLKKQNSNRVDKIEYKFDQLKVERLEGTLNIGITPSGGIEPGSIEDFNVSQNKVNVPKEVEQHPQLYKNIQNQIHGYLDGDCFNTLKSLEQQYQYPLDSPYRSFIIDDVRKQIDQRIQYYINNSNLRENKSVETLGELEQSIVEKVKQDINKTIEQYIKHLPKGD